MNIDKDLDCIIVGSGPGGATVAREMSRKKKKVFGHSGSLGAAAHFHYYWTRKTSGQASCG